LLLAGYINQSGIQGFQGARLFTVLLKASGKIIEFEMGWRAEQAEILAVGPIPGVLGYAKWAAREAAESLGVQFFETTRELCSFAVGVVRPSLEKLEGSA
jgi:hypothetical protein